MTDRTIPKHWIWAGLGLWAALAAVFAFTDQQLSEALIDEASGWAGFLELYGQLPGQLVGLLGGAVLLRLSDPRGGAKSVLAMLGVGVLTLWYSFGAASELSGAHADEFDVPRMAVLTVVFFAAAIGLPWLFDRERLEPLRSAARLSLAIPIIGAVLTVWAIKIPWGRWTARDIAEAGDPSLFTPWYLPQGVTGHHSFVSGHTAFSFVAMTFAYWFRTRRTFVVALWVGLAWGVLGGLSRIVIGAHWPSDTLFGGAVVIVWLLFLARRVGFDEPVDGARVESASARPS